MEASAGMQASIETSRVQALEQQVQALEKRLADLEERAPEDRVAIIIFSGDLDRALAAFIIATGAASMGQQVSMFFTFWGLGRIAEGHAVFRQDDSPENDGADVAGLEQISARLENELFRRRRKNAARHDEGQERQFARRNDRASPRTRRPHDRLRNVPRPDGHPRRRNGRRPGMWRRSHVPRRRVEIADEFIYLGRS